ncbi:MAG: peptide-methionine (S)-S-oxide reductase MsrA [Candidatus Micrarchaeota archaeon]
MEAIVFGGGCFWCTEAVFKMMKGLVSVLPGYSGGHTVNPGFREVSSGTTGHVEVVKVDFGPKTARLADLLEIFFASHDPTQLNRQGNDTGTQYRSAIYYSNGAQEKTINKFIKEKQKAYGDRKIVTEIGPLGAFYPAEERDIGFFAKKPLQPYCMFVISPKVAKIKKKLSEMGKG